jgi:predicted kinase
LPWILNDIDLQISKGSRIGFIGVTGSGKSTYAKKLISNHNEPIVYLSSDELRAKFGTGEEDQTCTSQVFSFIKREVDNLLKNGKNVLVDATNVNRRDRKDYIETAKKHKVHVNAFVFKMDRGGLIERNVQRGKQGGRVVPDWVIDKMLNKYEEPSHNEGIDDIIYV